MAHSIVTFKSNLPTLTVLKINSQNIEQLQEHIRKKIRQAPMMFIGMHVIIDVSNFDKDTSLSLDLTTLKNFLLGESIYPIAVMSDNPLVHNYALETGLGCLPTLAPIQKAQSNQTTDTSISSSQEEHITNTPSQKIDDTLADEPRKTYDEPSNKTSPESAHAKTTLVNNSKIIRQPIRSGQSVYAQGDLTIIGSVSPGAEVIADGSIHIYGTLRGRAIAGAHGNTQASIFCQYLDAELIAIAGNYTHLDDSHHSHHGKTVQISLENEKMSFFPL